jgi:hypothetical protein
MATSSDGAAAIDLYCDRFDDFEMPVTISAELPSATFQAEIRLQPDTPGDPLASLTISTPVVAGGNTTFTMSLAQAAVEALPASPELGDNNPLYWDLKMILVGKRKTLFRGKFTVIAGVTRP